MLAAAPEGTGILVVDDASPDGTGELADRLAAADRRIDVLHRSEKLGLGPAYVAGFAWALASGAERIVQMDADFSHDPADVPRLIAATMDDGLGRRPGARLPLRRPAAASATGARGRQAISRWGSIYARTWLGLELHDLTGGFKCYRRAALEAIRLETVSALGYAFQIETTYRAVQAGYRVVEVPIIFSDRRVGESKMSRAIVAEAAWRVPIMRLRGGRWG